MIKNKSLLGTLVFLVVLGTAVFLIAATTPAGFAASPADNPGIKIEPGLRQKLKDQGPTDFIVRFVEQVDLSPAQGLGWQERGEFVYNALQETALRSQANAKVLLSQAALSFETFIAGNELYVFEGTLDMAKRLTELPEVESIRATRVYHLDPVLSQGKLLSTYNWVGDLVANNIFYTVEAPITPDAVTDWGITDTKADQFWSTFGVQGDGILVANIDTGVQWNHPALVDAFNCPGDPSNPACWEDPSNICGGSACDNNGHGTHTMGTMVSDDNPGLTYIAGMAPNANWIACKGCESTSCSDYALNTCADWILAPGGEPANRPHVVNNSWGGWGGDAWYLPKVNAWRAAGVFPAFSAGNNYTCNSLGSPGDYQESFASASHKSNRVISSFSSKGPSTFGHEPYTKPNISAPGDQICSSVPTNSWSCGYSGTSMASPHSAGAVALLWSCNPGMIGQIDDTFQALQNTADAPPTGSCGAPPDGEGNYTFGYGYLNVLELGYTYCGGQPPAKDFKALLTGAEVVPPVSTNAKGLARFRFNETDTQLRFRLMAKDIVDVNAAHMHCAPPGVNGPVGVSLWSGGPITIPGVGVITQGTITAPDPGNTCGWVTMADVAAAMRAGEAYVQYHTVANPAGEVRGQIQPLP